MRPRRILYAEGPGNLIGSYFSWRDGQDLISETSYTYSGLFFDFCKAFDIKAYAISYHKEPALVRDGRFVIEHRPKPIPDARGLKYHFSELRYGASIMATAARFNADAIVVASGATYWLPLSLLGALGIRIVPSLHNALWPKGFPPTRRLKRAILFLDGIFWRHFTWSTICVSPELERQVREIAGRVRGPIIQMRGLYRRNLLDKSSAPPEHGSKPFHVLFAGRIERNKGVFDVVEIASKLEARSPGLVQWQICGDGGALSELRQEVARKCMGEVIQVRGRLNRFDLARCYEWAHVTIVPTRSDFCEGLPLVIIEAILAGRPVITSTLSNALDVVGDAIIEAQPDDPDSYLAALEQLIGDRDLYFRKTRACARLQEQFYDPKNGFSAALKKAFIERGRDGSP